MRDVSTKLKLLRIKLVGEGRGSQGEKGGREKGAVMLAVKIYGEGLQCTKRIDNLRSFLINPSHSFREKEIQ